ncbi:uncharacterized protein LOC119560619 [Drosophila subpulchrella]|uniref:uncharacterized protein LOC119560619 n=1 Tax=Drosophila subpulchrella TaxID=1486046 RepID=UPI0018A149B3|nr:uncharacterized protein LOC119560619 [Drosophila subpulchrella]
MAGKYNTQMILLSCSLALLLSFSEALPRYSRPRDLATAGSSPSLAYAPSPQEPMTLTGNYNLIMPDYYDNHPAESMQLQNFANFHDAETSPDSDLGMEESQFLTYTPVRAPQPLTAQEKRARQQVPHVDIHREKKALLKLKKGNTQPRGADYQEWDQFDYDLYSLNPGNNKKYNYDI